MKEIVLHSNEMSLIGHWQNALGHTCRVIDTLEALDAVSNALIIISHSACERECKSVVQTLGKQNNMLLVLARVPEFATAKELLKWGVKGYGNALMRDHFLVAAVETLREGMVWLYPEFTTQLIKQLADGSQSDHSVYLEKLSDRECEVALLLKEGDLYKTIAEKLEITPRTVKAHAQNIYTKLYVKDRLGLALLLK